MKKQKGKTDEFWFEYDGYFYNLPKNYTGYFKAKEYCLLKITKGKLIAEINYLPNENKIKTTTPIPKG